MIRASDGLWYRDLDARILGEGGMTDESYQRMVQFEVMRQQTVKHAAKKLFEQHAKPFHLRFLSGTAQTHAAQAPATLSMATSRKEHHDPRN